MCSTSVGVFNLTVPINYNDERSPFSLTSLQSSLFVPTPRQTAAIGFLSATFSKMLELFPSLFHFPGLLSPATASMFLKVSPFIVSQAICGNYSPFWRHASGFLELSPTLSSPGDWWHLDFSTIELDAYLKCPFSLQFSSFLWEMFPSPASLLEFL